MAAVASGNIAEVQRLLKLMRTGGSAERDSGAQRNLAEAVKEGQFQQLAQMLESKADANATDDDGMTALHFASAYDQLQPAKLLIEAKAKLNICNHDGATPFMVAVQYSSTACLQLLLASKASVESRVGNGHAGGGGGGSFNDDSPLIIAARSDAISSATLLLRHKADPSYRGKKAKGTALLVACANNSSQVCSAILEAKADLNVTDDQGDSAVAIAARMEAVECMKTLLSHKASPDYPANINGSSDPPVLVAVTHQSKRCFDLLIAARADLNAQNKKGDTPLTVACLSSQPLARRLIEAKADVNKANSDGDTPLMLCMMYNAHDTAKLLVEAKADVNLKNNAGQTASDISSQVSLTNSSQGDLLVKVREAHARGDLDEAKELMKNWKEMRGVFES
uniref:Uncharacterized protein n=1 Tax=Lotharella oceanica TaxID=641309 RepID=A0A7S2TX20_9EUKA